MLDNIWLNIKTIASYKLHITYDFCNQPDLKKRQSTIHNFHFRFCLLKLPSISATLVMSQIRFTVFY